MWATDQISHAIKPVTRNRPICTTALLRPIVAIDPKSRYSNGGRFPPFSRALIRRAT